MSHFGKILDEFLSKCPETTDREKIAYMILDIINSSQLTLCNNLHAGIKLHHKDLDQAYNQYIANGKLSPRELIKNVYGSAMAHAEDHVGMFFNGLKEDVSNALTKEVVDKINIAIGGPEAKNPEVDKDPGVQE